VTCALERVPSGDVEYLAVRSPDGAIVAKGGIDYTEHKGAGTMWQLATQSKLQSRGIGAKLIKEMERHIRARGITTAVVGVEDNNLRARALYERLGYEQSGRVHASWESMDANGRRFIYKTEIKDLSVIG
jgi:ribosomal protein S18 acetylase RimI-like enzyme